MAIRGVFLAALVCLSVLAALTLTTTAFELRGTRRDGGATRTKTVAGRRSLADSGHAAMPSSPKGSSSKGSKAYWDMARKACVGKGKACAKAVSDNFNKKDGAKMVAGAVAKAGGIAVDAAAGVAAARKGDKEGAKKAAVDVVKGAGTMAVAALGPKGALVAGGTVYAANKAKPHLEKFAKHVKAKLKEKREANKQQRDLGYHEMNIRRRARPFLAHTGKSANPSSPLPSGRAAAAAGKAPLLVLLLVQRALDFRACCMARPFLARVRGILARPFMPHARNP
ncbi:unnamed protein product [Closterium sp. Naga37s-1]|nr:unnamed protein product [Closterium sp. Naga37s-1]CAI5503403.1 unnamed protein product [Closterium sp. Naga37s-1]